MGEANWSVLAELPRSETLSEVLLGRVGAKTESTVPLSRFVAWLSKANASISEALTGPSASVPPCGAHTRLGLAAARVVRFAHLSYGDDVTWRSGNGNYDLEAARALSLTNAKAALTDPGEIRASIAAARVAMDTVWELLKLRDVGRLHVPLLNLTTKLSTSAIRTWAPTLRRSPDPSDARLCKEAFAEAFTFFDVEFYRGVDRLRDALRELGEQEAVALRAEVRRQRRRKQVSPG